MIVGLVGRLFRVLAFLNGRQRHAELAAVGEELVRLEDRRRHRPATASR